MNKPYLCWFFICIDVRKSSLYRGQQGTLWKLLNLRYDSTYWKSEIPNDRNSKGREITFSNKCMRESMYQFKQCKKKIVEKMTQKTLKWSVTQRMKKNRKCTSLRSIKKRMAHKYLKREEYNLGWQSHIGERNSSINGLLRGNGDALNETCMTLRDEGL